MPISGVITKITLEKTASKAGKPYALFNFQAAGALSPEAVEPARSFGRQVMEIVSAAQLAPELQEAG